MNQGLKGLPAAVVVEPEVASTPLGQNLVVKNTTGTETTSVTVTADEIVLRNSANGFARATSVNAAAVITSAGAGGLDSGSEANSTWYHIHLIAQRRAGGQMKVAVLLSTSATAPRMPAPYTYRAYVGAVYNNSGGNFDTFYQVNNQVWVNATAVFSSQTGVAPYTSQSLSTIVPSTARTASGCIGSSTATNALISIAGDANGLGEVTVVISVAGSAFNTFRGSAAYQVPLKTAQTVYWKSNGVGADYRLTVSGYTF
jgi:hypothetical protein